MTSHNTITIALRAHARPSSTSKLLPQLIINHRFCLYRNDFSERVVQTPDTTMRDGEMACVRGLVRGDRPRIGAASCLSPAEKAGVLIEET